MRNSAARGPVNETQPVNVAILSDDLRAPVVSLPPLARHKSGLSLFILAAILLCRVGFAAGSIRSSDISSVNLGDSMKRVTQKLGAPKEVLAKETTADGKEQVTWRYDVMTAPRKGFNPFSALGGFIYTPPRVDQHGFYHQGSLAGGLIGESPGQMAASEQAYLNTPQGQAERMRQESAPTKMNCTVIFVGGKVSSIKQQEST